MAEERSGSGRPEPQEDPGWEHGELIDPRRKRVKCKWCHKEMNGGVYRLKQHIAGISGDVKKCEACPRELRDKMRGYMTGKKVLKDFRAEQEAELQQEISGRSRRRRDVHMPISAESDDADDDDDDDDDDDEDAELRAARQESLRSLAEDEQRRRGAGSSRPAESAPRTSRHSTPTPTVPDVTDPFRGPMDPYLFRKPSAKQKTIKQAMRGVKAGAHAVKNIVKWFLHAGVPSHTASSPYFQTMLDAVGEAGPGLKAPTPKDIYGKGLDEEVEELKEWIDTFKAVWKARGCTLMCDGWTGTTRKSMINFLVYCTEGTIFLKSVDASHEIKNADYLFRLMDEVVEEIGEENLVQVVTDNEASYKAAGRKLMEKRPHLYWVPCAAHSLDLMMEDIGKDEFVSSMVTKAQMITSFIYSHNRILNMMRIHTKGRDLLRAGPTRFASNFISLESLSKHKHQLATLINSEDYLSHVATLKEESRRTAIAVNHLISDHTFWNKVGYYLRLIEPIVQVLRMVDGDDKNDMGYLYEAMDKAKEKLRDKHPTAYRKWWNIIDQRWDSTLHHDLHAAGFFFNPRYHYTKGGPVQVDGEVFSGTVNVIRRLSRSNDDRINAELEMERYQLRMGVYGSIDMAYAVTKMSPAEWWNSINYREAGLNALAYVAIRVLSQTTSSSQCERNWSTFSLIHTKIRNRLSATRLEKLVYCHYNMRLRVKNIKQRQNLIAKRLMQGHASLGYPQQEEEDQTGQIDVDDIMDEEHPLHAWVEVREEVDDPVFDPADREWAEGELDGVVARDPELRVSSTPTVAVEHAPLEPARHSASLPETPRLLSAAELSQRKLKRSSSHMEHSRGKSAMLTGKEKRKSKEKEKSQEPGKLQHVYSREHDTQASRGKKKMSREVQEKEAKQKHRRDRPVRSDDTTQAPSDDDDDDGATAGAAGATTGGGILAPSFSLGIGMTGQGSESQGGQERQAQGGGYEGQQRQAGLDWGYGYGSYYPPQGPQFQPSYSDVSSTSETERPSWGAYGVRLPTHYESSSGQEPSSSTRSLSGLDSGFEDLASSLFGYGYGQYMQPEHGSRQPHRSDDHDGESSPSYHGYY